MDRLWRIIDKENISIQYRNINNIRPSLYGLYLYDPLIRKSYIILDICLKSDHRLQKCVLAEEIGHYYTAPKTNYLVAYANLDMQIQISQDERKAAKWATDFLIPDHELSKVLKLGYRSCFEIAEYFDVTEWLVHRKFGTLKICFRRTGIEVSDRENNVKLKLCMCD